MAQKEQPVQRDIAYTVTQTKYKDLLVYRQYHLYGIGIIVEIDRRAKKVSLVEWDEATQKYHNKDYTFAGRELNFMNGWIMVLRAMEYAITEAKAELEKFEEEDEQEFVAKVLELQDRVL